jgi:hypothetical protein
MSREMRKTPFLLFPLTEKKKIIIKKIKKSGGK